MANDYSELIQFLGKKFERIDEQFEEIRNTFTRKEDLKAFATKDDLEAFATKDDLKAFATKDDLEAFATKDDLKAFATKDDLEAFATKDDLKAFATKDDLEAFATKDDLKAQADDYVHQNKIIAEDLQHKMDLLIEGFRFHDEKNERDKADVKESIDRLDRENLHMNAELFSHDKRIKALEEGK